MRKGIIDLLAILNLMAITVGVAFVLIYYSDTIVVRILTLLVSVSMVVWVFSRVAAWLWPKQLKPSETLVSKKLETSEENVSKDLKGVSK